jgi:hypothetical protein
MTIVCWPYRIFTSSMGVLPPQRRFSRRQRQYRCVSRTVKEDCPKRPSLQKAQEISLLLLRGADGVGRLHQNFGEPTRGRWPEDEALARTAAVRDEGVNVRLAVSPAAKIS